MRKHETPKTHKVSVAFVSQLERQVVRKLLKNRLFVLVGEALLRNVLINTDGQV